MAPRPNWKKKFEELLQIQKQANEDLTRLSESYRTLYDERSTLTSKVQKLERRVAELEEESNAVFRRFTIETESLRASQEEARHWRQRLSGLLHAVLRRGDVRARHDEAYRAVRGVLRRVAMREEEKYAGKLAVEYQKHGVALERVRLVLEEYGYRMVHDDGKTAEFAPEEEWEKLPKDATRAVIDALATQAAEELATQVDEDFLKSVRLIVKEKKS